MCFALHNTVHKIFHHWGSSECVRGAVRRLRPLRVDPDGVGPVIPLPDGVEEPPLPHDSLRPD